MIQHMQFTKLFNSILDSTIWQEPLETKVVWITMLAMCDRTGEVHASVPGLAKRAGVTLQQCNAALACLESPDEYSRTKTHDGRRIREIDGGWELLNHAKYRALLSAEERREYNKNKQAQYRAEKAEREKCKNVNDMSMTVNDNVSNAHITDAEAEADTKKKKKAITCPQADVPEIAFIWSNSPPAGKMRSSKKQLAEAWKKLRIKPTIEELKTGLDAWNKCPKWRDGYAEGIHIWLTNEQWENLPEAATNKPNGQHKGIEEIIPLRRL